MSPFPREAYRPLEPYAPDRRPIAVDLSDNTNRWGAHPGALRAVRQADPEELLRYPPVYADRLREVVARRFGVPEEAVATGCGSDDLLDSAFRAAGEPGEGVAFVPPTFSMIEIFARMNGMVPMPVAGRGASQAHTGPSGSGVRSKAGAAVDAGEPPDPGDLLAMRPALVYICRPNNPTGEVQPFRWIEELAEAGGPDGPVILLDEAYAEFMEEPSFLERAVDTSRVVVLRTLSKVYGLAGLRVGFAVGAPEVIREMEKSRGPYKVNRLGEAAGVAALEDSEGWVPGIVAAVRSGRAALVRELRSRGFAPLPSGANFVCVPLEGGRPASGADDGRGAGSGDGADGGPRDGPAFREVPPTSAAVTAALRERDVAVRPFPGLPGIGEAIRVSIGPPEEMARFLSALDGILDGIPHGEIPDRERPQVE
jgi:histidinol-phosphate/aromatic aminotransferase/cobyric acid decarboxylase-like protein